MIPAGRDFKPTVSLAVNEQVDKLIASATAVENLGSMFIGWCFFWVCHLPLCVQRLTRS